MYTLEDLGWDAYFQQQLTAQPNIEGAEPARVAEELKGAYRIINQRGVVSAFLPGRFLHAAASGGLPSAGDWVLARSLPGEDRALIERLLERRTKLSRQQAGEKTGEQLLAANVDIVFVVASLNREYNVRRIERYLTAVWESGARPILVLNKADLAENTASALAETQVAAPGVPVQLTSAATGEGIEPLQRHLNPRETGVFVGSSGVGKSSIINRLAGREQQAVHDVRSSDDRGRHTTTSRQLLVLPGRGVIIDTPGLRELQLWDGGGGAGQTFAEIAALAQRCAFRDCTHEREPGCAVRAALEAEELDEGRLRSYRKLERERLFIARKHDQSLQTEEKRKWKRIQKNNRQRQRVRGR
ncbi:MAG: ribosome small subunit-dependent GTPase A [Chloroflexi bacterium]|nr:MAG: ribosome small subunit-dependent GTPase A [Chloroflexota bacterium]